MKNIFLIAAFFGASYLAVGCKSNTTQVIYTNDGKPGTIVGKATLYDSVTFNGGVSHEYHTDESGVKVSILGISLSGITGKDGRYSISNVPPGAYRIAFSKNDYTTSADFIFEFAGNGTDEWDGSLHRMSHKTPTLVLRAFGANDIATFTFKVLDPLQDNEYVVGYIFFSKTQNIDPSDQTSYFGFLQVLYTNPDDHINLNVAISFLLNAGFVKDDKIYCEAFTGNIGGYTDLLTGKSYISGFSPYTSGVKSFILP